jgi:hypothetical protein
MRYLLEMGSWLAMALGFMGAVAADVFCWREAYGAVEKAEKLGADPVNAAAAASFSSTAASFSIAGAILTAGLAIAIVIYMKSAKDES